MTTKKDIVKDSDGFPVSAVSEVFHEKMNIKRIKQLEKITGLLGKL